MFHIPKGKISQLGLNTVSYDGAKLWIKLFDTKKHKETDLTKFKLKNLLKIHFLNTYG